MLERIAALEAMLQQAPIVSGRFTSAPYLYLAKPLHQDMSAAVTAASQLGRYPHPHQFCSVFLLPVRCMGSVSAACQMYGQCFCCLSDVWAAFLLPVRCMGSGSAACQMYGQCFCCLSDVWETCTQQVHRIARLLPMPPWVMPLLHRT